MEHKLWSIGQGILYSHLIGSRIRTGWNLVSPALICYLLEENISPFIEWVDSFQRLFIFDS